MIRQLLGHTAVYGLANFLSRGTVLVSVLVLARILGPQDYGAFTMLTLFGAFAGLIVPLQVTQGLAWYYGTAKSDSEKIGYASTAWWFTAATQLLFLIALETFARWGTERVLGDAAFVPAFRLALVVMVLNSLLFFVQCQFRWSFRVREYTVATLVYGVFCPVFSIGMAVVSTRPLEGALIGQGIGTGVPVLWSVWKLRAILFARVSSVRLRQMLVFAAPLVPATLAILVVGYAPRIVLNDLGSLSEVGVFAFASQLGTISTIIVIGLQASLFPFITAYHAEPGTRQMLGRVFEAFGAAALVVCLGLGLFAADAIAWIGASEYARAGLLVLLLAPASLLIEMHIFAPGFWIAKRTGLQAAVCIAAACFAYGSCYLLTSRLGLLGAAIGSLMSAATFFIAWWIVASRFYRVPVEWARLGLYLVAGSAAGAAALLLTSPGTLDALIVKVAVIVMVAAFALVLGLVRWRAIWSVMRSERGAMAPMPLE